MPVHYARADYACQCLMAFILDYFQALGAGIGRMAGTGGVFMRGEKVIARAFGGHPLVRRVWAVGNGVVYLASEVEFEKREAGGKALEPIGFPVGDVFAYSESFLSAAIKNKWEGLKQWQPEVKEKAFATNR